MEEWLQLFQEISCFYRYMMMYPLWQKYQGYQEEPIQALKIFLEGYAFERQGARPDYRHAAVVAIDEVLQNGKGLTAENVWKRFSTLLNNERLNPNRNPLCPPNSILNILMVDENGNIHNLYQHLVGYIQEGNINAAFNFLASIRAIGKKIASFYLRDLVVVSGIDFRNVQNRNLLQPIDVWVERIVQHFDETRQTKHQVADWIVKKARQHNLNPEYINMGMWFYGSQIAGSKYNLMRSLGDLDIANELRAYFSQGIDSLWQNYFGEENNS